MTEKPMIAIVGPTATGKTALSVRLCQALGGEVISGDSMQIYRRMDIGTAKPSMEERQGIPHHLMDIVEPWENFSVADYTERFHTAAADVTARGRLPVLVGGTGLYIDAALDNTQFIEIPTDSSLRAALTARYEEEGGDSLLRELAQVDPETAARLHKNDSRRIVRALEIHRLTGKSQTEWNALSHAVPSPYDTLVLGLTAEDRQFLYDRIDRRVDVMLDMGLVEEARGLLAEGLSPGSTAMQAIGYKELVAHLEHGVSLQEAADEIRRQSRRYAKRQLTWFRRNAAIHWLPVDRLGPDALFKEALALCRGHLAKFAVK